MKRIENRPLEKIIIAKKEDRYLSFPDTAILPDGRFFAVWRDADAHVAKESHLMLAYGSRDGRQWTEPQALTDDFGHMPRITVFADGNVKIIDDGSPSPLPRLVESSIFTSADGGKTFARRFLPLGNGREIAQAPVFAPDKLLSCPDGTLVCAAQLRLGSTGRRDDHTFVNLLYRSGDNGVTWYAGTVLACERNLKLCEPSVCRMPDGRLLVLYRVNAAPAEHSRYQLGDENGYRFGGLSEAPFYGQRPTAGFTSDGHLLVTYRRVQKPFGVCAWYGTLEELQNGGGCELELCNADGIPAGDMGYSGWAEYAPGCFLCVTYHRTPDEPKPSICAIPFRSEDFR